jgi:glutamate---cysteine ligase / carboxylate-amine ligase
VRRAPMTSTSSTSGPGSTSAATLRATFDAAEQYTVGIEDEVMLLQPDTLELAPRAAEVLALMDGDQRFKLELPASQIEIVTPPTPRVPDAAAALLAARRELAERTRGVVCLAGAGVHPTSSGIGQLNQLPQYEHTIREFGAVAERQLVCALQVHVAIPGADRALAVYNAARSYLPWLAALAANAAFYEGRDSGLASVRPKLSELLPRQGVPPAIDTWETYAAALAWGAQTGAFPGARTWWWELRPHPRFATLEFRVPDAQATVADAAAIAALIQGLVVWLAERHDSGERLPVATTWRIEENRWSACRHGVEGMMADLESGTLRPTRDCLTELIDALEPIAARLRAGGALAHARTMVELNGAIAQRAAAGDGGAPAVARWLAERFSQPCSG